MTHRFHTSPALPQRVLRRADLLADGMTTRMLTRAVRDGLLVRPRRGHYLPPEAHPDLVEAVRCGGRLDCVSLLERVGVFVRDPLGTHVQLDSDASRVPVPAAGVVRHWRATEAHPDDALTPWVEALVQAVLCQTPRAAIATLDSAWHLGIVREAEIAEIFHTLPRAYRRLRPLLDRRAESGTETLVRLLLRGLGIRPELQVSIDGVGRVDLVVDGWLIIECDSREHHSSWEAVRADRRRDAVAAALGYTTVRLLAEDILYRPEWVSDVLRRAVRARGRS